MQYTVDLITQEKDGQKAAARLIDSIVTLLQIFSSQVKLKSRNETSIFIG
jgi:hypothetical protein